MAENQSTVQKVSVLNQLLTCHTHTLADAITDRQTDRQTDGLIKTELRFWEPNNYLGDSKTDERIKISTIFRFPPGHGRISAGAYLSNIWNVFRDFLCACLDCTRRVGARAWLHSEFTPVRMVWQTSFCCNPRARQTAAGLRSAKNDSCCSDIGMTVLWLKWDSRAIWIHHSRK